MRLLGALRLLGRTIEVEPQKEYSLVSDLHVDGGVQGEQSGCDGVGVHDPACRKNIKMMQQKAKEGRSHW